MKQQQQQKQKTAHKQRRQKRAHTHARTHTRTLPTSFLCSILRLSTAVFITGGRQHFGASVLVSLRPCVHSFSYFASLPQHTGSISFLSFSVSSPLFLLLRFILFSISNSAARAVEFLSRAGPSVRRRVRRAQRTLPAFASHCSSFVSCGDREFRSAALAGSLPAAVKGQNTQTLVRFSRVCQLLTGQCLSALRVGGRNSETRLARFSQQAARLSTAE